MKYNLNTESQQLEKMSDDMHEILSFKTPKQLSQKDQKYFNANECTPEKYDYPDVYPCGCEEDKLLYYANGFFSADKFVTKLAQLHRQQKMSVLEEKQKEYETTSYGEYFSNFSYVKIKERREKKRFNSKYREQKQRQCLNVQERLWSNIESPEIILTRTLDTPTSTSAYDGKQLYENDNQRKKFRSASFDGNKLGLELSSKNSKTYKSKRNKERRKSMTNANLVFFNRNEINENEKKENTFLSDINLKTQIENDIDELEKVRDENESDKTYEEEFEVEEDIEDEKLRSPQQLKEDMTSFILEGVTSQKTERTAANKRADSRTDLEDMLSKMSLKKGGGRNGDSRGYVNKLIINKKDQHWTQKSNRFKFPHVTTQQRRANRGEESQPVCKPERKLFTFPLPLL